MAIIRCPECEREVSDEASTCPNCGAPLNKKNDRAMSEMPENHMVWAIVTTICCCLPFGIMSIIQASKVSGYWENGEYDDAMEASEKAKKYALIGTVAGALIIIVRTAMEIVARR